MEAMMQSFMEAHGSSIASDQAKPTLLNILNTDETVYGIGSAFVEEADIADSTHEAVPNAIYPPDTGAQWSAGLLYAWSG